jgi:hypothetical protein
LLLLEPAHSLKYDRAFANFLFLSVIITHFAFMGWTWVLAYLDAVPSVLEIDKN